MRRATHSTTLLPRSLRDELGLPDTHDPDQAAGRDKRPGHGQERRRAGSGKKFASTPQSRKDKRKLERDEKKTLRKPQGKKDSEAGVGNTKSKAKVREESDDEGLESDDGGVAVKSILKNGKPKSSEAEIPDDELDSDVLNEDDEDDEDEEEPTYEEEDERPSRSKQYRGAQDKLAEDDAEIAALEKALGIKGKKNLPKSFKEDGLDEIMGGTADGSDLEDKKRKREEDEWLQRKRQKASLQREKQAPIEDADEEESDIGNDVDDAGSFEGFDDEDEAPSPPKKAKENPYVAPVTPSTTTKKYIPPSLRANSSNQSESQARLRRQTQGHLNKLSEANLISILSEIEKLYQSYPRQDVTSTLIDLLLTLVCNENTLNDSFINLHAGFIAAVYKVVGMDFGAQLVQRAVEQFDADYEQQGDSKEMGNIVTLLSHLYNLHIIGCALVFDYIRLFLSEITELNTELLLKIIKSSGPQLRQDDPSALKDIVLLIQPAISQIGEAALSVRTKFMIETITDLKNNKLKSSFAKLSAEQITRMRKIIGSLNSRNIRASEPLRIGRDDIRNSAKKGKWWLVGASWNNNAPTDIEQALKGGGVSTSAVLPDTLGDSLDDNAVDLSQLARVHRMNTDVRRSIFVAIMSASDCRDAHVRLTKLRLKRSQEVEIPHVLIHCASEEEAYNPYYTLIGRKLCGERKMKMAFMFALWNVFKRMGERTNLDDDDDVDDADAEEGENAVTTRAVVNLAKMYGNLVADGTLSLGILKILDFLYLQPKTRSFVELLLITTILQAQQKAQQRQQKQQDQANGFANDKELVDIFMRTRETPQVVAGLIYFVRKVVGKSDVLSSKREKKSLKSGCRVALDSLKIVSEGERGNS